MRNALVGIGKLTMVVLIASAGLANANMLTNPGFEIEGSGGTNDPAGWFRTHMMFVERKADSNPPEYGDYVLLRQDGIDDWHWASQKIAVTAGVEYVASADFKCYYRGAADERVIIYLEWHDSGGSFLGNTWDAYASTDGDYADYAWVSRSVAATAPAGAVEVEVRVQSFLDGAGDSAVYADNVVFTIPPPNLLVNPDFETEGSGGPTDPDGWDRSSIEQVRRWEEAGQSGHGDWMINFDDSPDWSLWASQTFPATAGDEFVAAAEFKAFFNAGESISVDLVWLDAGGTEINSNSATFAQSDGDYVQWGWATRSVTAMAPVGTTQVRMQMTSHLAGGGDSALYGDNASLHFLGGHPMVPATILSWTAVSNGVMEMVIYAPGITSLYHPEAVTDLAIGTWTNVPHSDTAGGAYYATNLSYSTTDATETNEVIYIQTTEAKKFFNIVGPE